MDRRDFLARAAAAGGTLALPAWAGALGASAAQSRSPQPAASAAVDLAEWSYFWLGVERVPLARGTVHNGMHMYVEYAIPRAVGHPNPIVLVHGGAGQGTDWMTTPDGRPGWATYLLQQGFAVYVVDRPAQGRPAYHPYLHGNFPAQAPTFENVSKTIAAPGAADTQWPGSGDAADRVVQQLAASFGPALGPPARARQAWRSRVAMLLDEIGPSIIVTHGDSAPLGWLAADTRPSLVTAIITIEPAAAPAQADAPLAAAVKKAGAAVAVVTADRSPNKQASAAIADWLRQAGAGVDAIDLAQAGVHGNGAYLMLEKNNRDALQPILDWIGRKAPASGAPARAAASRPVSPQPGDSTALNLADQGHFWVGVDSKRMPYGTIPTGQMFVQYFVPAAVRHPYPIVLVHGGGGQSTHFMGIGRRPGWLHFFVQQGYRVYALDRPSFGRSPYHPDALGPSHLQVFPAYDGFAASPAVINTVRWAGNRVIGEDPLIDQFMANESGNATDEAYHSELCAKGGVELLDRIGPALVLGHAFGGFLGWILADRRPTLVKGIMAVEINGNPFAGQLRWGQTAIPLAYDPPVSDPSELTLVDVPVPPNSPRTPLTTFKLQAEPAHRLKNLAGIPIGWLTGEFGGGGLGYANVAFLKQAGCSAELIRLKDLGIEGNGNLMPLETNNRQVFDVIDGWFNRHVPGNRG